MESISLIFSLEVPDWFAQLDDAYVGAADRGPRQRLSGPSSGKPVN